MAINTSNSSNKQCNANSLNTSQTKHQIRCIKILILAIFLACFLVHLSFFLFFNVENVFDHSNSSESLIYLFDNSTDSEPFSQLSCSLERKYETNFYVKIWHSMDTIFNFLLPFLTLSIGFGFTSVTLRRTNFIYELYMRNDQINQTMKMIYSKRIAKNKSILWKLLLINLYFTCSVIPYLISVYISLSDNDFLNNLALTLLYSNSALTFLFFGLTSQEFRFMFKNLKIKKC